MEEKVFTKVLSLDLGTSSIGWAWTDREQIVDAGVHIFPEGVEDLGAGQDKEKSPNVDRRKFRQLRRQFYRKRLRKRFLLQALSRLQMTPSLSREELRQPQAQLIAMPSMCQWLKQNPYQLRHKALAEDLTRKELGRIFYHFIQRRGFQSNSRQAQKDADGTIFKGMAKEGKIGIDETRQHLQATGTLGEYLHSIYPEEGRSYHRPKARIRNRYTTRDMYTEEFEAIWQRQAPQLGLDNEKFSLKHTHIITGSLESVRNRRRIDRLESQNPQIEPIQLERKQQRIPAHKVVVEEQVLLRSLFGDLRKGRLFYQRPLRSQKHRIGHCTYEPSKPRCPNSHPLAEYKRVHEFVNTIDHQGEKLSKEQREQATSFLLEMKVNKSGVTTAKFKALAKHLGIKPEQSNYTSDHSCPSGHTVCQLADADVFGKSWFTFSEKKQEEIWHSLHFFDDSHKLAAQAKQRWGLSEAGADRLAKIKLSDDYAQLSQKAIRHLLPFLKLGYIYSEAVALGGIRNAFGEERWEALPEDKKQLIYDNMPDIIAHENEAGSYLEKLKSFLQKDVPGLSLSEKDLEGLYHHSVKEVKEEEKWPRGVAADQEIQEIRNPVVIRTLFELRKLVNTLIESHGKPHRIKIELARDLKMGSKQRKETRERQKRQEKEREEATAAIREHGLFASEDHILRYRLWKEAAKKCTYSGQNIAISDLFSAQVQVDHIHPHSRSQDDSFVNKVVCLTEENRRKGQRMPYEWKGGDPASWTAFKAQVLQMFHTSKEFPDRYKKYQRLTAQKLNEGFKHSQLTDTAYVSRKAREYLQRICPRVDAIPGRVTARIRSNWGLNSLLHYIDGERIKQEDSEREEAFRTRKAVAYEQKNRADHRHHAIDAIVLAFTELGHVQLLSKINQYKVQGEATEGQPAPKAHEIIREKIPKPSENFWQQVKETVDQILVSYKSPRVNQHVITHRNTKTQKNGATYYSKGSAVRGALHKETIYGERHAPQLEEGYHVRKSLESLTTRKQIAKIVDHRVRSCVEAVVEKAGGYDSKGNLPAGIFFKEMPPEPQLFLANSGGEPMPLREVHSRGELIALTEIKKQADVEAITDERERVCVEAAIKAAGGYDQKGNIPTAIFFKGKAPEPQVFLPNRNGDPVPVLKVRMRETMNNAAKLKEELNQHVNPRNNHHAIVYKDETGQLKQVVRSFWEVVEGIQNGDPMFEVPDDGVEVARLQENDMFLIGLPDDLQHSTDKEALSPYLYRVQKLSGVGKSFGFCFRKHTDARPATEATTGYNKDPKKRCIMIKSLKAWVALSPVKLRLGVSGKILRDD